MPAGWRRLGGLAGCLPAAQRHASAPRRRGPVAGVPEQAPELGVRPVAAHGAGPGYGGRPALRRLQQAEHQPRGTCAAVRVRPPPGSLRQAPDSGAAASASDGERGRALCGVGPRGRRGRAGRRGHRAVCAGGAARGAAGLRQEGLFQLHGLAEPAQPLRRRGASPAQGWRAVRFWGGPSL